MVNLNDVYQTYRKWLLVPDEKRIDAVLAVAISRTNPGNTPLWLILIGNSGDWKTVQLKALEDADTTFYLRNLTKNTLINGNPRVKDLAPDLDGKLVLIPEMAPVLKLDPKEKAQVWAQLRDLFDGNCGKIFGTGKRKDYTDLKVTMIMGSTPAIDHQILIHQDLGTRELIWRTSKREWENKNDVMQKVWDNQEHEKVMTSQLNEVTKNFIREHKYMDTVPIMTDIQKKIFTYAAFLCKMRATAEIDSFTSQLIGDCHPEEPTRVLKQFKILFKALKSLDKDYPDNKALDVIRYVTVSSSDQNRINVLIEMIKDNEPMSCKAIAQRLKVGWKTVQRELNILWNLELVDKSSVLVKNSLDNEVGTEKFIDKWELSSSTETQSIVSELESFFKIIVGVVS